MIITISLVFSGCNNFKPKKSKEDLKIAFEYNGKQHYEYIPFFHKTFEEFESQKKRDLEKREISLQQGVILIEIPFMYNYQNPKKMYNHIVSLLKRQDSILIVNR